jgi:hypothetical protein
MTHDQKKTDDLLRKIRALKAKAEGAGTTEAEAMVFTAKVAEMLTKHGLEEAQLRVEDQLQMGHEAFERHWNASPARHVLVVAVCRLYLVHTIRYTKGSGKGTWILIGRKHNIIMVREMAEYLIKTVLRLSNQHGDETGGDVVDFRRGCFMRLAERLEEMRRKQAQAAVPQYNTATGNPGNLPALYKSELDLARAYVVQHWGEPVGPVRAANVKQGWDAMAGRAAADRISLHQQVADGHSDHLLSEGNNDCE